MEKESIPNEFQSKIHISKIEELEAILKKISKTLSSVSKSSLGELKSFAKPPALVELSLQCLCILFGRKPIKMPGVTLSIHSLNKLRIFSRKLMNIGMNPKKCFKILSFCLR